MKMKKIALSLVAVAACAGAFRAYESYQQSGESDALLAENVEALSAGDGVSAGTLFHKIWKGGYLIYQFYQMINGRERVVSETQVAYLKYVQHQYTKHVSYFPNGQIKDEVLGHYLLCTQFNSSTGVSDCTTKGERVDLD